MNEPQRTADPAIWQPYDPYPEPCHPQRQGPCNVEPVRIRHPGYVDDTGNTLLKFWTPAHHETARIACAIVANNAWGGYLATDREGRDRVNANPDIILKNKSYYFHAAQPNEGKSDPLMIPNSRWVIGSRCSRRLSCRSHFRALGVSCHAASNLDRYSVLSPTTTSSSRFMLQTYAM
jgi:hypothetical protein